MSAPAVPADFPRLRNPGRVPMATMPVRDLDALAEWVLAACGAGGRVVAWFGAPALGNAVTVWAVLADEAEGTLSVGRTEVEGGYPALTPRCPQLQGFERELAEQYGVRPEGHPWLKPVRFAPLLREAVVPASGGAAESPSVVGVTNLYQVEGAEIHEVAVGPVHAGIIEPGHFRFQCHGETVLHLEMALGYQHRGVERALVGGPGARTLPLLETLAGDTTIGHTTAGCQALEALAGVRVPARAQALRAIALELERLANHTGDLGALANDVGYLPTASYCGRIRGDFLNLTALACGNRFGRGWVRPGGVGFDLEPARVEDLRRRLDRAREDVTRAVELLWNTSSVRARFENAGPLTREACVEMGLVGVVARACGLERDVRHQFPSGLYQFAQLPVSTYASGNVFARAYVRWLEIQRSLQFLQDQLQALPGDALRVPLGPLAPESLAVTLTEGWRGEIAHVVLTDARGRIARYKVVDPSFHNWMGLALAMRDQPISDFPLCNKSFNLSYCGHDL